MNRAIEWFARNPVAANLMMAVLIVGGLLRIVTIRQEVFPVFSLDVITVSVEHLGASPDEVEESVCLRIEEAVAGIAGVKRIRSKASEGIGVVTLELMRHADSRQVLDEVKSRVDSIETFPEETRKPVIQEVVNRTQVIDVAVHGDTDEGSLKHLGEMVRDEIAALDGITLVELSSDRPYEISIEVSEKALRRFGITFDLVADAVRRSSIDLPAGSLRTSSGEILLRTRGRAYRGRDFESIALKTRADGTRLLLSDVARVVDGFAETDQAARFDGRPAVLIQVYRVGSQSALDISRVVHAYVEEASSRLPEGISLTTWKDNASILRGRLGLMLRNAALGFVLVFVNLALFLRLRLAFWVSLGIPITFLGALWLMPTMDLSINLISLFAFIIVLGIVVDDAIIVGENIFTHQQREKARREIAGERNGAKTDGLRAAIAGAQEMATPVTFAVLTSVAAFIPMINVPGNTGKIMRVIPLIVITTLAFSLIESLFILPAHLSHWKPRPDKKKLGPWLRFQGAFARRVEWLIDDLYKPTLRLAARWRYVTLSAGGAVLLLTYGFIGGGFIKFVFFPNVEADFVAATLTMPQGTSAEVTSAAVNRLEKAAFSVRDDLESTGAASPFKHVSSAVGDQPFRTIQARNAGAVAAFSGSHIGEVTIELLPSEERSIKSIEILDLWREAAGSIPGAVELKFTSSLFSPGEPINIQFAGYQSEELLAVAEAMKTQLARYPGVYNVADSHREGKQQIDLKIKPSAEALGLTQMDLARQVRQSFYGEEAQRIQRGRDDVRVMVRYPEDERRSLARLERMRIRTRDGREVPFSTVADARRTRGFAAIDRVDRKRAINVTADVDDTKGNAGEIIADLEATFLPELLARHRGVRYTLEGQGNEQAETMAGLGRGFALALVIIYGLMAIPFRSYVQPLIVMGAIPFGLVGAIWGHLLMGMNLTILSVFGMVALTGVVVNDSLVLVDYVNRSRRKGMEIHEAVMHSGVARFRPVLLTSLTTFAGLAPLILERSVQAQFLIPMAISLGFGVLFATGVSLILVPCTYLILQDIKERCAPL